MMLQKSLLLVRIQEFNVISIAQKVIESNQLKDLVLLCLSDDKVLSFRATWVLAHCDKLKKNCAKNYYKVLIENLQQPHLSDSTIRNTLRLFQKNEVPKNQQLFLIDCCFKYIQNPLQSIAIRSFSITIIYSVSKPYPELLNELKLTLLHIKETDSSPGMISKVKNTLKLLD